MRNGGIEINAVTLLKQNLFFAIGHEDPAFEHQDKPLPIIAFSLAIFPAEPNAFGLHGTTPPGFG
jgi:hypothetical protein